MPDNSWIEQGGQNAVVKEYENLATQYPPRPFSKMVADRLPYNWLNVSDKQKSWAESYLSLGNNGEILEYFGESLAYIGEQGLHILREVVPERRDSILETLKTNLTTETLLNYVRIRYQIYFLDHETQMRHSRRDSKQDPEVWDGMLNSNLSNLRRTMGAFRELNDFVTGKTKTLKQTKEWLNYDFLSNRAWAIFNQGLIKDPERNLADRAEEITRKDDDRMNLSSALGSFVENLELSANQ